MCKKGSPDTYLGLGVEESLLPVPLALSNIFEMISHLVRPSPQILSLCPYCEVKMSDTFYSATLHMSACKERKFNCPRCTQVIPFGIKSLENHLKRECRQEICCEMCEEQMEGTQYFTHWSTICHPFQEKKSHMIEKIRKLRDPVTDSNHLNQIAESVNTILPSEYLRSEGKTAVASYIRNVTMDSVKSQIDELICRTPMDFELKLGGTI